VNILKLTCNWSICLGFRNSRRGRSWVSHCKLGSYKGKG